LNVPPLTVPPAVSRVLAGLGWAATILAIALGSAGLVTALNPPPGGSARPELTWAADEALRGPLDAIVDDLEPIRRSFDALGGQGRTALAALVAADADALEASIVVGRGLVGRIGAQTAAVQVRLAALPGIGPGAETRISATLRARVASVGTALDVTTGIAENWAVLSSGAATAARLARVLAEHEQAAGEAVRHGSQGNYQAAVVALDAADPALLEARALRDQLANTADVATLTQWLDRNAVMDAALRRLYSVLAISGGVMVEEAREALAQVNQAQAQLPPDTRVLVVVMSDVARAGLNSAVIQIEQARGRLAQAIALLRQADASPGPGPDASPVPEPEPSGSGFPVPGETPQPQVTPPDA